MSFLNFEGKTYLISGVNNKKSVAFHTAVLIRDNGGKNVFSVQSEKQKEFIAKHFPDSICEICDVTKNSEIINLSKKIQDEEIKISGFLHSMAFAKFTSPYINEISFTEFSEALHISAFSLSEMSQALRPVFTNDASVVTVSISNLRATNYGYMGPIKSTLESSVDYLAKSFSKFSSIRFNAIAAGPLKTSASAGIPGYVENYLHAEKLTLRKQGLATKEVSQSIGFLLSSSSSGINATTLTVDAGMNVNYFDEDIVFAKD